MALKRTYTPSQLLPGPPFKFDDSLYIRSLVLFTHSVLVWHITSWQTGGGTMMTTTQFLLRYVYPCGGGAVWSPGGNTKPHEKNWNITSPSLVNGSLAEM